MIKITTYILLLFISFKTIAITPINPEQLTNRIKTVGAKMVISELFKDDESQWRVVLSKISGGENNWLAVAALLAPESDAASAETLTAAVAKAIPHNPAGVLAVLNDDAPPLSTQRVCSLPFYSITEPDYNKYIVDSIQKLYKVANSKDCIDTMVNTIGKSNGFIEGN